MLKQINLKNFLTFDRNSDGSTIEFSMSAGRTKKHEDHICTVSNIPLLKAGLIYGANGSGKSNLIKAFDFMQNSILGHIPSSSSRMYNRNRSENKSLPSYFEMEFMIDGHFYSYGFEIILSSQKIVSEWLVKKSVSAKGVEKETVLYERDTVDGTYKISDKLGSRTVQPRMKQYLSDMTDNQSILYLTDMVRNRGSLLNRSKDSRILLDIFEWFQSTLTIIRPNTHFTDYFYMVSGDAIDLFSRILESFGTGIKQIQCKDYTVDNILSRLSSSQKKMLEDRLEENRIFLSEDSETPELRIQGIVRADNDLFLIQQTRDEMICKQIVFLHEGIDGDNAFSLAEESDGTIRLIDLLEILVRNEPRVYLIDELDRCLHPNLVFRFVDLFLQRSQSCPQSQIISTTHCSSLMDFGLVRRDEIWFVTKDTCNNSSVYSLEEYNERFDRVIEKAYREGRYQGVPVFSTVFPDYQVNFREFTSDPLLIQESEECD